MNQPAARTEPRPSQLWPALSVLTALTYNTWLLWRPLNGHAAIFRGYLSELAASDQPYSFVFRGGDLITALIVFAMGLRALVLWRRRHRAGAPPASSRWWAVAAGSLLVFALATFCDAFFAMDCSPVLSASCKLAEEQGQLSLIHYAHTYTSVGAQVGIVASMVASYIAMRRSATRNRRRQLGVLVIATVEILALLIMMAMLALGLPGLGYPQAVMVLVASAWFAAIGFRLVGEPDPDPVVGPAQRSRVIRHG